MSNIQIINFAANGSGLTASNFDVTFASVTIINGQSTNDAQLLGVNSDAAADLGKRASNPEAIDLTALSVDPITSFTLETANIENTNKWAVANVGVIINFVTAVDSFTAWADGYSLSGPDADKAADPDGDGMLNFLEFAIGGDPTVIDTSKLPSAIVNGSNIDFSFEVSSIEVIYEIQSSTDLSDWTMIPAITYGKGALPLGNYVEPISMSGTKLFLRLEVSE